MKKRACASLIFLFLVSPVRAQFDEPAPAKTERISLEVTKEDLQTLSEARKSKSEDQVLKAASRILGKDEKNLAALNTLAVYYYEADKPGLSKIILNRALESHPNVPALHNNMGVVYLKEGKQRQAIASFRKSLELKADYSVGATNLASIYLDYKDYSRALSPFEEAYKSVKKSLDQGEEYAVLVANNYAVALTGIGELKKAESVYEEILKANSKNSTVLLNYAILLVERLNNPQAAASVLNKLKFVSDNREVLKRVEELEKKANSVEQ